MNMMIFPKMPDFTKLQTVDWATVAGTLLFMAILLPVTFCVSYYAASRWKGRKGKTIGAFMGITGAYALLLCCLFGLGATTVRGVIFCLILLVASYSDMKTRECDDWLHVMIVITACIGCDLSTIAMHLGAAILVWLIMFIPTMGKSRIGGADIKCAAACSFVVGLTRGMTALVGSMLLAVLMNVCKNKAKRAEGFALVPYLAVGFLTVYLF